jgi:acetyl-CoA C-acetyltransferase
MALDPQTPVLVGVGAVVQREDDAAAAKEPVELMIDALARAGEDAGAPALLAEAGTVIVPKGIWSYPDPARIVADRFGAPARTVLAEVGILQQSPFTLAAGRISAGDADVVLVAGGEAKYRALRAQIAGTTAPETAQDGITPDERVDPHGDIISQVEIHRGLAVPARQYAVMETALRAATGTSVDAHLQELAELQSAFSHVAAGNPDAWDRTTRSPADLAPSPANRVVALPYTKLHCSQWNVDLAAGHILCSVETATRHGIPRDRWVFPVAAAESNTMIPLTERAELHRSRGFALGGRRLFEAAGTTIDDIAHLDLYSCFPAAVRIQARELGVADGRPLTVTGGMTFAGGPLNNYVLQTMVTLARVLRADPGSLGLSTSVSGMITKQGLGLWSTEPPVNGFTALDVSDEVAQATRTLPSSADASGDGEIAGYTVVFDGDRPAQAIVVATVGDVRTVATSDDPDVAAALTEGEWVGRTVTVVADGGFTTTH